MERIGFTGTSSGLTDSQLAELDCYFEAYANDEWEFHHGDCIGADAQAHEIAKKHGATIIIHPPIHDKKRAFCEGDVILEKKPYLKRNHDIVNQTSILYVCPKSEREVVRSGTWATYRYADKRNKIVNFVFPEMEYSLAC